MSTSPANLQMIIGKRPFRVWKGVGSFMLFEFGRSRRKEDGSRSGTYTLWIYMAEWTIRKARREIAHCESPDRTIHRAAETLTNKKIESAALITFVAKRQVRHGAVFRFEGGYSLRAWAYVRGEDDEDVFFLYSPDTCISYRPNGMMADAAGAEYRHCKTLSEARSVEGTAAVMEGDYGGQIYFTCQCVTSTATPTRLHSYSPT